MQHLIRLQTLKGLGFLRLPQASSGSKVLKLQSVLWTPTYLYSTSTSTSSSMIEIVFDLLHNHLLCLVDFVSLNIRWLFPHHATKPPAHHSYTPQLQGHLCGVFLQMTGLWVILGHTEVYRVSRNGASAAVALCDADHLLSHLRSIRLSGIQRSRRLWRHPPASSAVSCTVKQLDCVKWLHIERCLTIPCTIEKFD